jgi:OmpA-OmpF porin, OOP family
MSSLTKILVGGLATTALAWFLHGPMQFGAKCAVGTVAAPDAIEPAANVVAATPEQVVSCQTNVDATVKGQAINFTSGGSSIAPASLPLVEALATSLKACSGVVVEVAGHTDVRGNDASNLKLSQARADSVVRALTERGVAPASVTGKGYGETKLLDPAATAEADAKNRRIDFSVATSTPAVPAAG